jgi:ketosteroid isomerase-like protein
MTKTLVRVFALGALVAAQFVLAACATTTSMDATDLSEAKDLDRQFVQAMSAKDLDAAMACFWDSPDLIVVLFGNVQRGAEAVWAGISRMFAENDSVRLTVNEANYVPVGDAVMTVGTATYDLQPTGGPSVQIVEVWTDLKRKIGGRWVYVLDQATMIP